MKFTCSGGKEYHCQSAAQSADDWGFLYAFCFLKFFLQNYSFRQKRCPACDSVCLSVV